MTSRTTKQIQTRYQDASKRALVTELVERELQPLREREVLVEMLYVPMHGSFWLASHPRVLHPRSREFLQDGAFVFGNGGVGRVAEAAPGSGLPAVGDYVTIFGHLPCGHSDCAACSELHQYTECEYDESMIIGHGKGAPDGTYAQYVILPPPAYQICYRAEERPTEEALIPFMYAFLAADVRNALKRGSEALRRSRMLLLGAGQSGHIAAYLHLQSAPDARIFAVEPCAERAASLKSLNPDAIDVFIPPQHVVERLASTASPQSIRDGLSDVIEETARAMRGHFDGRSCDLLFDASSGNTAPLWDNRHILSPGCHCIVFGFGSERVILDRDVLQLSGLRLQMSRGVGDLLNRRVVVDLIKGDGGRFIREKLIRGARRLADLDEAIAFVGRQHGSDQHLHEISSAYMTPCRAS